MSSQNRHCVELFVVLGVAGLVVLSAEWWGARLLGDASPRPRRLERPDTVLVDWHEPLVLPPRRDDRPLVLMMGNSHMYALPGPERGAVLQTGVDHILVDELADQIRQRHPDCPATFYVIARPNLLPIEMLTRVGHLLFQGHRPKLTILGLTWRNIARDSQMRHELYEIYRDPAFVVGIEQMLADPKVAASGEVIDAIHSQLRQIEHDAQLERTRSDADRLDDRLARWCSGHSTLQGKSAELRARIFMTVVFRIQELLAAQRRGAFSYDLVQHDYTLNVQCLEALVRLLKSHGSEVVCYYAPERSDLPPLMDPAQQSQFMTRFERQAKELGVVVLDARPIVPDEYWGWEDVVPDRSHFMEPGHRRLAAFLHDEIQQRNLWSGLERP